MESNPSMRLNKMEVPAMPRQVLVVHDEPNIRELCPLYLEQEDSAVQEAVDGIDGLEKARASP